MKIQQIPTEILEKELAAISEFMSADENMGYGFSMGQAEEEYERISKELERRKKL